MKMRQYDEMRLTESDQQDDFGDAERTIKYTSETPANVSLKKTAVMERRVKDLKRLTSGDRLNEIADLLGQLKQDRADYRGSKRFD